MPPILGILLLNSAILVCLVFARRRFLASSPEYRVRDSAIVGLCCGFASCLGYYVPLLTWIGLSPIPITDRVQWNIAIVAVLMGLPISAATLVCGLMNQKAVHGRLMAQSGFFLFFLWLIMAASGAMA